MSTFNLTRARAETPGCEHVIHFNNAGAALMPQPVLDTVTAHWQLEARIGGYEAEEQAASQTEAVYDNVARLVNGRTSEIALVESATTAWNLAFHSIPFQPGDRILTAKAAYASNYIAYLQMAQRRGVTVDVIPDDEHGQLSVAALREMWDERVKLIAITHAPTNGGLVNPAAAVGEFARETDTLFLLDACQSVGQLPVDVAAIGCDFLSATGRKFLRGPRGTGFLYVRRERLDELAPPFLDLRGATWTAADRFEMRPDARRFEFWESNVAGRLGLGTAAAYALAWNIKTTWARTQQLAQTLRQQLAQIPGVVVHDKGQVRGGIVTFTVDGMTTDAIKQALHEQKINVTTSTIFSTRLDMADRHLPEVVRASLHYYNSEAEIERFCETIKNVKREA
ncbi:MAG: aminotransferase class V-fold PLP-dependent enzyme [Anaerolineae bacterium]